MKINTKASYLINVPSAFRIEDQRSGCEGILRYGKLREQTVKMTKFG